VEKAAIYNYYPTFGKVFTPPSISARLSTERASFLKRQKTPQKYIEINPAKCCNLKYTAQ
jgi:hypothetical protein